ncbi:MAG: hypothetical protein ACP5LZ_06110 [Fervidicoccaceae archaeon]
MKLLAEVVFELNKGKKRFEQVYDLLCKEKRVFDGIDIPESPLGMASLNSIVIGALMKKSCPDITVFSHLRLVDISPTLFLSLLSSAELANIDGVFVTYGEKNEKKNNKGLLYTEDSLTLATNYGLNNKLGAILSLSYSTDEIMKRLETGFKKFLVLRLSDSNFEKFVIIAERARKFGKELYPYIIIKTERNSEIIDRIGQPSYELHNLENIIEKLGGIVEGIVISTAGDFKFLRSFEAKFLRQ